MQMKENHMQEDTSIELQEVGDLDTRRQVIQQKAPEATNCPALPLSPACCISRSKVSSTGSLQSDFYQVRRLPFTQSFLCTLTLYVLVNCLFSHTPRWLLALSA
jgi:hypothetical protein